MLPGAHPSLFSNMAQVPALALRTQRPDLLLERLRRFLNDTSKHLPCLAKSQS